MFELKIIAYDADFLPFEKYRTPKQFVEELGTRPYDVEWYDRGCLVIYSDGGEVEAEYRHDESVHTNGCEWCSCTFERCLS